LIFDDYYISPLSSQSGIPSNLYLKGEHFHLLSQFETKENKKFIIKVSQRSFYLTKEEIVLLSPKVYYSIYQSGSPFLIPFSSSEHKIPNESLIKYFDKLVQLFSTKTEIKITLSNIEIFRYLNKYLENRHLNIIFPNVSPKKAQIFSLTSKMFSDFSLDIQKTINNFTIYINEQKISCNKQFASCLSNKIFQIILKDNSLNTYHFKSSSLDNQMISLFGILTGSVIQSDNYSSAELIQCFFLLGFPFQIENFEFEDFDQLVSFLSLSNSNQQEKLFESSIKKVVNSFNQLTASQFIQLP
jgi:hypothetical protein